MLPPSDRWRVYRWPCRDTIIFSFCILNIRHTVHPMLAPAEQPSTRQLRPTVRLCTSVCQPQSARNPMSMSLRTMRESRATLQVTSTCAHVTGTTYVPRLRATHAPHGVHMMASSGPTTARTTPARHAPCSLTLPPAASGTLRRWEGRSGTDEIHAKILFCLSIIV